MIATHVVEVHIDAVGGGRVQLVVNRTVTIVECGAEPEFLLKEIDLLIGPG